MDMCVGQISIKKFVQHILATPKLSYRYLHDIICCHSNHGEILLLWQPQKYLYDIIPIAIATMERPYCHSKHRDIVMMLSVAIVIVGLPVILVTTKIFCSHNNYGDNTMFLQQSWCYPIALVTKEISYYHSNHGVTRRYIHVMMNLYAV